MPNRRDHAIRIQLIGGLGNQLFGYVAGLALARKLSSTLEIDTSWTRFGMTDHGVAIREFDLPGHWLRDERPITKVLPPGSIRGRAGQKIAGFLGRFSGQSCFYSWTSGDAIQDVAQRHPKYLRGYFQHISFLNYLDGIGEPISFNIRRPSEVFQSLSSQAENEQPIALHVRMGDYRRLGPGYQLDTKYFDDALTAALSSADKRRVWLFSDEPHRAVGEIPTLKLLSKGLMIVPPNLTPAETLVVLRNTGSKILSNSTFGWWGAIHTNAGDVYVPTPWTFHAEALSLIPSTWTQVQANFR